MLDTALYSLRKRMRAMMAAGTSSMIGVESPIIYNRMEREIEHAGDRYIPGDMLTYWTVRYFDRD
jgi:hypothetical protein